MLRKKGKKSAQEILCVPYIILIILEEGGENTKIILT